ncbi:unnamed protein product [Linum trigynum]
MDYSGLPVDILDKIVNQHLHALSQLLAFSGVSKSWRSVALPHRHRLLQSMQLPGLLISQASAILPESPAPSRYCGPPHDFLPLITTTTMQPITPSPTVVPSTKSTRRKRLPRVMLPHFPSLSDVSHILRESERHKKMYIDFDDHPYLGSTVQSKLYVASKDGWILIIHPRRHGVNLYLFNPITNSSIPLPPLPFPANPKDILKALISSSPDSDQDTCCCCHVIILFRSLPQLAWCNVQEAAAAAAATKDDDDDHDGRRAGGWKFTSRDYRIVNIIYQWRVDMDYFGGKLYVLEDGEHVSVVEGLLTCKLSVRVFPLSPAMSYMSSWRARAREDYYKTSYHLANLRGQLLVILSHRYDWYNPTDPNSVLKFEVYKLVSMKGGDKGGSSTSTSYFWAEVTDLDGHAVFLGSHQSFCLPADPLNNGVKGNRIYFVFEDYGSNNYGNGCGMFDLGNQRVERFCHHDPNDKMIVERKARSFWFLPMPWDIQKHRKDQERMLEHAKPRPAVDVAKVTKRKSNNNKKHQQQQHDGNKVSRLANRFQALLDEDEDEDEG